MALPNATQARDALAWATNNLDKAEEPSTNPLVWFMEAMQGDFNENRSTRQILLDAAVSMIPLVDQVCDIRDLIADCRKIVRDIEDGEAWIALILTLIGLFPSLGSLVKGVLKIFFAFVRRLGPDATVKAVELGMTWVITYLRRRDVQKYLRALQVDDIFKWLAKEIRAVRNKVSVRMLLDAFDKAIDIFGAMVEKARTIPFVGSHATATLKQVKEIRLAADARIGKYLKPVQDVLDTIVRRLEHEALESRHGIVNANNIHFKGALPEASAVTLMRTTKPKPAWLSKGGNVTWSELDPGDQIIKDLHKDGVLEGYPKLSEQNIKSFHKMETAEIDGPARLYRILAPNSRAMSDCWVSEEVFNKLQNSPDPRAAWRKYLAVWPDWNVNGQFVIYDVKRGETLKVWRGPASSQVRQKSLPDHHLEGGWEQVMFKLDRGDARNDTMRYYQLKGGKGNQLRSAIGQKEFDALSKEEQKTYTSIREEINHPNINGPFETGWGYTDFGGEGFLDKVGLPALPGQTTTLQ